MEMVCCQCNDDDREEHLIAPYHRVKRIDIKESIPIVLCDRCYMEMRSGWYSWAWKDV